MRDCKRHPSHSQPGGGVCARCLQERLVWLWRGESFRLDDDRATGAEGPQQEGDRDAPPSPPSQQVVGTIASSRKHLHVNGVPKLEIGDPRNNGEEGDAATITTAATTITPATTATTGTKPDVIVEWAEFHAHRRNNSEQRLDSLSPLPTAKISRSLDSMEFRPFLDRLLLDTDIAARSQVSVSGSRSMPLNNRSAEETALRVIREVEPDRSYQDEFDVSDTVTGNLNLAEQEQGQQHQRRRSCKWVMKLLASPIATSRNKKKVFPSRVGSRKRLMRFNSADWSRSDVNGEAHWKGSALRVNSREGLSQNTLKVDELDGHHRRTVMNLRSSVFSWLQDVGRSKRRNFEPAGRISSSPPRHLDLWLRDLTTVGHLHEIAEGNEITDDSELEEIVQADSLGDVSSFGNFLLTASQRQPRAGLTRLSSRA